MVSQEANPIEGAKNGDEVVEVETKAPSSDSQKSAPKFIIKQTDRAKKNKKPLPTFTVGEMIPWKGVWMRVVEIESEKRLILLHILTEKKD